MEEFIQVFFIFLLYAANCESPVSCCVQPTCRSAYICPEPASYRTPSLMMSLASCWKTHTWSLTVTDSSCLMSLGKVSHHS